MSRYDFALLAAATFGLDKKLVAPITTPQLHQVAQRPGKVSMNTHKIQRVTGLQTVGAAEGLQILKSQLGD